MFTCWHTEPTCRDAADHEDAVERESAPAPVVSDDPYGFRAYARWKNGGAPSYVKLDNDFTRAIEEAQR